MCSSDLDGPIGAVMTPGPITVAAGSRLSDAIALLEARRLSELPVVAGDGRAVGLLDIVDLVGLVPADETETSTSATSAAA